MSFDDHGIPGLSLNHSETVLGDDHGIPGLSLNHSETVLG
ncbi:hypothetical protein Ppa05_64700 [Planomonospora parontospora subsp. antibiotica]|nr:hypothetical protein Ppa05_64700 [Planomonospora parontospora subsp. antibiotica]